MTAEAVHRDVAWAGGDRPSIRGRDLGWTAAVLFLLALALRLWGIWNVTTTDEYNEVLEALRVGSGHLNFERWNKRVYLYLLAVEYGAYFAVGWLMDVFQSPMHFAARIVRNMEPLFLMGRVTSALCGTLTVAWLYLIGRRFFSPLAGPAAALLLTLTVFHIDLSQQAKVDALLGLLVTGSLYFILGIATGRRSRWYFAGCGALMALAIQTKINAVVLGAPLLVALVCMGREDGVGPVLRRLAQAYLPAFLAGFVLGNPAVLLAPGNYIQAMLGVGRVYSEPINVVPRELIGFLAYPLFFYRAVGPGICVLAVAALVFAVMRPDRRRVAMLGFIAAFYLVMGASSFMVADYYLIPAMPFLYLLIGDLISELWRRLVDAVARHGRWMKALASVAALLFLMPAAWAVARHEISLAGPNTRYLAKEWIETNIPPGSRILMDSGKSINSAAPLIAEDRASLERVLARARADVEQGQIVHGMVDRNALIYYELLLQTVPEPAYDITSTMFGLHVEPIGYYLENGFDYFVISARMKQARTSDFFRNQNPDVARFYASLDRDRRLRLVKVIAPGRFNRGDTFWIYRLVGRKQR